MFKQVHTLIIGAGPAGLNAARYLKGDCLVFDMKKEVGVPVRCGEAVSLHALTREGLSLQKEWIANESRGVRLIMPNGKVVGEKRQSPVAVTIRRDLFEKYLAGLVKHPILLNTRVTDLTRDPDKRLWIVRTSRGDEYAAKYVMGADGPLSLVGRRAFHKRNRIIAGIGYELSFARRLDILDELHMYLGNRIAPKGYGWFFPLSEHSANVGLLLHMNNGAARKHFDYFLKKIIAPKYGPYEMVKKKSGPLPAGGFFDQVYRDHAFLLGDAGGFTDPIFEGGLNAALLTGRYASECVNAGHPSHYQDKINRLPFTPQDLLTAREILYGFDDETLNTLGDIMHGKGIGEFKSHRLLLRLISKSRSFKQSHKILELLKIWSKAEAYLW